MFRIRCFAGSFTYLINIIEFPSDRSSTLTTLLEVISTTSTPPLIMRKDPSLENVNLLGLSFPVSKLRKGKSQENVDTSIIRGRREGSSHY